MIVFHKYHALGNDYLVADETSVPAMSASFIRRVCDRHRGVGADGILLPVRASGDARFGLRIFNPDGSEAEKSGNGLRIFARYLWDQKAVHAERFSVSTPGGTVACQMREAGTMVFVEMGTASFDSEEIPIAGSSRTVVAEPLHVDGREFHFTGVTVGNPHCVIHLDEVSAEVACRYGPRIETLDMFPQRTNVQFAQVLDRDRIRIEIWERGAGYTLASGSSSCAAAAASVRRGFCDGHVAVEMPGGILAVQVRPDYSITMLGPVERVAKVILAPDFA